MIRSHVTLFENSASLYASASAFKIPTLDPQTGDVQEWTSVSYQQFWLDLEACARRWSQILRSEGIGRGSVVGVWLLGVQYTDLVHVYSLSRAGYIPQMISFLLPNPSAVYTLLERGGAKALICGPTLYPSLSNPQESPPLPIWVTVDWRDQNGEDEDLPDLRLEPQPEEVVMILHTSGSTSGMPKIVPMTYRWFESAIRKAREYCQLVQHEKQIIATWMGSICHGGQHLMMLNHALSGSCVVQPTRLDYSSNELSDMIDRCGVNCIEIFTTYFSVHLRNSRGDARFLDRLKSVGMIEYAGLQLSRDDTTWARQNRLKLRGLFASTECGILLHTSLGHTPDASLYHPFKDGKYAFVPVSNDKPDAEGDGSVSRSHPKLLEMVVLSSSGDRPDASLLSEDGCLHTGDLFEEVKTGQYTSQGRSDDWIKLFNALRCNTREVEDTVRATCGDLIDDCMVVGSRRPSIALVVEAALQSMKAQEDMKREIVQRISHHNSRLLLHERILDPRLILLVPSESLPRTPTKGNIRRKATEELFKDKLDDMYGKV